jgi:ABC-type sugar transport system ATPase subunit
MTAAKSGGGVGIIFISHKLAEVRAIARRLVVMRQGAVTAEIDEAMEERVMFRYHTNPVKIIQDDDKVVGILSVQM